MNEELVKNRDYWNKEVENFDSIYSHKKYKLSNYLDKIFRWDMYERFNYTIEKSKPIQGKTFLDVGCGTGIYSIRLAKEGASEVVGIDVSDNMIKICNERAEKDNVGGLCKFYLSDLTQFKTEKKFNVVFGIGLFDYIKEPLEVVKKMHEVSDNRIIASFPRSGTWRAIVRKIRLAIKGCPVYFYSRKKLDKLLIDAGFNKYELEVIGQLFCITAFVNN